MDLKKNSKNRYIVEEDYIVDTDERTISVPSSVSAEDYPETIKVLQGYGYRVQLNILQNLKLKVK